MDWINNFDGSSALFPVNIRPSYAVELLDSISSYDLFQINFVRNFMCKILDLIFCNNCDDVTVTKCISPLSKIEKFHEPIDIYFKLSSVGVNVPHSEHTKYDFGKARIGR